MRIYAADALLCEHGAAAGRGQVMRLAKLRPSLERQLETIVVEHQYPPVEAPVAATFTPQLPSIITPATISHGSRFPWLLLLPIGFLLIHGPSSSPGPIAVIPPPSTFVCWEEPVAHCDARQAVIRHR